MVVLVVINHYILTRLEITGLMLHEGVKRLAWLLKQSELRGIPIQQKSHTAENENSVPYSRILVNVAI